MPPSLPVLVLTLLVGLVPGCGGAARKPAPPPQDCRGGKVWHADDGVRFRGCVTVDGSLELGGALQSAEDFAALRLVHGDLVLGPSYQLNNLAELAGLRRIDGNLHVQNNMALGGLFLGAIEHIGGGLRIEGNTQLQTVSMHNLREIVDLLSLGEANRVLQRVDLSGLKKLNGVQLQIDWQKGRPEAVLRAPLY